MEADDPALPARLAAAKRRFEGWRVDRPTLYSRIPEDLWAVAVRCADEYGVYRTVRVLGLDYRSLKRRVKSAAAPLATESSAASFVELVRPGRGGDSLPACVLELENGKGARLRIELRGSSIPDVIELARRFGAEGA